MRNIVSGIAIATLAGLYSASSLSASGPSETERIRLTTVAIRVHRMVEMVAFYEQAFGARFREVETSSLQSRFGEVGGITLKLVPLRESVDFENYPSHQLGFEVPDVEAVIALAVEHGGRQEGPLKEDGRRMHAAIRDPDGNTIEIYRSSVDR